VADLEEVDAGRAFRTVGGHVNRLRADLNRCAHVSDLQVDLMQIDIFLGAHRDPPLVVSLETWLRNMHAVGARYQTRKYEGAAGLRFELTNLFREIVG